MSTIAPAPGRQRGAALVVGLVLLMVLTVLAVSAMRTATLGLTMATNAQARESAFQLAESGIQATLRQVAASGIDLDAVPACPATPRPWSSAELPWGTPVAVPALRGRYEVRLCGLGATHDALGSSFGFTQLHYRIESRGRSDQRNAEAIHVQGFYREYEE